MAAESTNDLRARLNAEILSERIFHKDFLRKRMPTAPTKNQFAAFKRFIDGQPTFPSCLNRAHFPPKDDDGSDSDESDDDDDIDEDETDDDYTGNFVLDKELIQAFDALNVSNYRFVYVYFDIRYFKRTNMTFQRFIDGVFYIGQGQDERHTHDPRSINDPVVDIRERHLQEKRVRYWRVEKVFVNLSSDVANEIEARLIAALDAAGKHRYDPLRCMRHWNSKCMCNSSSGRLCRNLTPAQKARYSDGQVLLLQVYNFFIVNMFEYLAV